MNQQKFVNCVLISKKDDGSISFSLGLSLESLQIDSYFKLDSFSMSNQGKKLFPNKGEKLLCFNESPLPCSTDAYDSDSNQNISVYYENKKIIYKTNNETFLVDDVEKLDKIRFNQAQF